MPPGPCFFVGPPPPPGEVPSAARPHDRSGGRARPPGALQRSPSRRIHPWSRPERPDDGTTEHPPAFRTDGAAGDFPRCCAPLPESNVVQEFCSAPPARTTARERPRSAPEPPGAARTAAGTATPVTGVTRPEPLPRPPLPRGTRHRSPQKRRGPLPRREGPFGCRAAAAQLWAGVLPDVVLEQQAADGAQQRDARDHDQPGVPEGQRQAHQGGRQGQPEGPVAAGAEEAQLAGAVGDVGVLAVLRAGVDAAGDEPEEAADRGRSARRRGRARSCRWAPSTRTRRPPRRSRRRAR